MRDANGSSDSKHTSAQLKHAALSRLMNKIIDETLLYDEYNDNDNHDTPVVVATTLHTAQQVYTLHHHSPIHTYCYSSGDLI
jgi:hypothetical protein